MPRRSAAAAADTRRQIVERAVTVASVEGLEGITFGRLAADLHLSKAGLVGHFPTKEELQLATLREAIRIFRREVVEPGEAADPGLSRLERLCDAWLAYIERATLPGGCFMSAASFELDDRPGRARDVLDDAQRRWREMLEREARVAVERGQLPPGTDPAQVAFELSAAAIGVVQTRQLLKDADAGERGRAAMRRALSPHSDT